MVDIVILQGEKKKKKCNFSLLVPCTNLNASVPAKLLEI